MHCWSVCQTAEHLVSQRRYCFSLARLPIHPPAMMRKKFFTLFSLFLFFFNLLKWLELFFVSSLLIFRIFFQHPHPTNVRLIQCYINSFYHYEPFVTIVYNTTIDSDTKLYHGEKYLVTESMINSFTWQMNLTVKNLHKIDFAQYTCGSENALGKSDARIRLQGKQQERQNNFTQFVK